ncbi:hypothetical protein PR048_024894 [Dryococelus australis]|uniref:Uncharacterized protein n=1 Tax=Dryococelus australis TaxID=614101 RepID=A0ABQ9GPU6_9NEOP|nr:hypothetical protein PR048_024894 [Dryococelus australis]
MVVSPPLSFACIRRRNILEAGLEQGLQKVGSNRKWTAEVRIASLSYHARWTCGRVRLDICRRRRTVFWLPPAAHSGMCLAACRLILHGTRQAETILIEMGCWHLYSGEFTLVKHATSRVLLWLTADIRDPPPFSISSQIFVFYRETNFNYVEYNVNGRLFLRYTIVSKADLTRLVILASIPVRNCHDANKSKGVSDIIYINVFTKKKNRRTGFNPRPGHQIFACENRAGRCRWSAGFLGDLPFPAFSFRRRSILTSITLIGSEDLAWLNYSPFTKANRLRFPADLPPDFRMCELCRTMSLAGGFSRGSPVSPVFAFRRRSISHLASPSSALKTSTSRAAQISSPTPAAHGLQTSFTGQQKLEQRLVTAQSLSDRKGDTLSAWELEPISLVLPHSTLNYNTSITYEHHGSNVRQRQCSRAALRLPFHRCQGIRTLNRRPPFPPLGRHWFSPPPPPPLQKPKLLRLIGARASHFAPAGPSGELALRLAEADRPRWLRTTNLRVPSLNCLSANTSSKNGVDWLNGQNLAILYDTDSTPARSGCRGLQAAAAAASERMFRLAYCNFPSACRGCPVWSPPPPQSLEWPVYKFRYPNLCLRTRMR